MHGTYIQQKPFCAVSPAGGQLAKRGRVWPLFHQIVAVHCRLYGMAHDAKWPAAHMLPNGRSGTGGKRKRCMLRPSAGGAGKAAGPMRGAAAAGSQHRSYEFLKSKKGSQKTRVDYDVLNISNVQGAQATPQDQWEALRHLVAGAAPLAYNADGETAAVVGRLMAADVVLTTYQASPARRTSIGVLLAKGTRAVFTEYAPLASNSAGS